MNSYSVMGEENGETNKSNGNAMTNDKANECGQNDDGELLQRILHQIEYYFGDINLLKDKFMREQIKLDDGWIPMSTMLKFQRLAKLSHDPKLIAKALENSELIEVDESAEEIKIRRTPGRPLSELNDEKYKELQSRSVYCKGFPLDFTMDNVLDFFQEYGPTDNIIMRKYKDKISKTFKFKGSIFVTFRNKEKAKEFLDIPSVKCKEKELIRMWQLEYIEKKSKEVAEAKAKKNKNTQEAQEEKDITQNFPKGATLHLTGDFTQLSREDIKDKFNKLGYETAYIAFNKGEEEARVRLQKENIGKEFIEKHGKELEIGKSKLEARLLEGEEEEAFLKKAAEDKNAYLKKCYHSRQGSRRGKGRGKNSRKRKGDNEDDATPAKKPVEAE